MSGGQINQAVQALQSGGAQQGLQTLGLSGGGLSQYINQGPGVERNTFTPKTYTPQYQANFTGAIQRQQRAQANPALAALLATPTTSGSWRPGAASGPANVADWSSLPASDGGGWGFDSAGAAKGAATGALGGLVGMGIGAIRGGVQQYPAVTQTNGEAAADEVARLLARYPAPAPTYTSSWHGGSPMSSFTSGYGTGAGDGSGGSGD